MMPPTGIRDSMRLVSCTMGMIRTVSDIANAVRGRRTELGLSQDEVAQRAGVSRKWIYEFEAGQPAAELRKILAVIDALDLRLSVAPADDRPPAGDDIDLDAHLAAYGAG